MSYSLYQASVPTFTRSLNAFLAVLDKAEAHAAAAKFDPQIYLTLRLRPDMYAFPRQVQAFCDHAKIAPHRVAGLEPPRYEDTEATLDELRARIRRTLDVIAAIDPKAIDAGAHCVRVNPGNIGTPAQVRMVVERARQAGTPLRVGVNSGSCRWASM